MPRLPQNSPAVNQGVFQLVPAAAHVFFGGGQGEYVRWLDRIAGFVRGLRVDADLSGKDEPFGFFATFTKAAFNHGLVESSHAWFRQEPAD